MSDSVNILVCEFIDYDSDKNIRGKYYGYRIYDGFGGEYDASYDSLDDVFDDLNPEDVSFWLSENHSSFYDSALQDGGLYLCGEWISIGGEEEEEEDD